MHCNGNQPKTPKTNGNGYIVVPKWFVSFLSFMTSVVFIGAVLWAWSISNDVSSIKAEIKAANELRATALQDVRGGEILRVPQLENQRQNIATNPVHRLPLVAHQ